MICQNCQTTVDNDLIFCTNCGERISGTINETKNVLMNDSVTTKTSLERPVKSSPNLKWIALIVALAAIPASIFGVYLLMNSNNRQTVQNTTKQNSATKTPPRNTNTNQNSNWENAQKNTNSSNTNQQQSNTNTENNEINEKEIFNERIEISPNSSYAKSFTIDTETAKIIGKIEVIQGETFKGFVYLQKNYDDYFPDETYKMFSFGEEKKTIIEQTIVKENYVLIFANETDKSIIIQGKVAVK